MTAAFITGLLIGIAIGALGTYCVIVAFNSLSEMFNDRCDVYCD